ncbi:lysophospholipid acyltransferase family protein [Qingshengfaniella alkalisoli]|uniref:Lysophospholipid acyltransferase family protein n=1 Tax=Qingshengfaniella alkalisoli TaxID=2599296 RepID=A0A5B8J359_9RHOB|nr:lysophospholipid acyltransferase family protein [Qingshengfaniella alkalisoli]QDY68907.1 lysophospholipid acyltransferase family protein [Qingshengfaniella alkalisoli]
MAKRKTSPTLRRIQGRLIVAMIQAPLVLPYDTRMRAVGWLMSSVAAPLAGYRKRIRENLSHAVPDLPKAEVERLCRAVPANTGRMLVEISSGQEFIDRIAATPMTGPGVADLDTAKAEKRPIIVVSGHFGNFDAARCALALRGHEIGALYRPVDDPYLDRAFHDALTAIAAPVFPRGRKGLGQMLRFLRKGNALAILPDQHVNRGAPLTFFGKTALTSLSAADMALKYNALLVPVYGIRDGAGFDIIAESPIPHSDAETMMQAVNDSLEARIRENMDQWLWIHRRWKPERQRKASAARISP